MSKIETKILKKMKVKSKNFDDLSEKEKYKFNTIRQKKIGKKEYDYFEITEPGGEDKIFKYKNLKEWDKENYEFQKKHKTMVRENYDELYMPGDWFRALELNDFGKRELTYGQLESARSYVTLNAYEKLSDYIEYLYPSIHVRKYGTKMFEPTEDKKYSQLTDFEIRSAENEEKRKLIEKKLREFSNNIEETAISLLKPYKKYTFRKYSNKPRHDMLDKFIIGGFEAAENISFKTFFHNFVENQQPVEYLDKLIEIIYRKYKRKLK